MKPRLMLGYALPTMCSSRCSKLDWHPVSNNGDISYKLSQKTQDSPVAKRFYEHVYSPNKAVRLIIYKYSRTTE